MFIGLIVISVTASATGSCHPAAATAQLRLADTAITRHDYRAAGSALDVGLRLLGSGYTAPPTIDDSGMHLVLADNMSRRGNPKLGTKLKRSVLVERIGLCSRTSAR